MKKNKKEFFITDLFKSIINFDYYKEVINKKLSDNIRYFLKLMLLYSIILTICTIFNINQNIKQLSNFINTEVTNLTYSNGTLSINNDESKTLLNKYIIIDTNNEDNTNLENKAQVVIGKKYCSIKFDDYIFRIRYNDYFYEDINKEDIIKSLSNLGIKFYMMMSLIILVWCFVVITISTFLDILVITVIGFVMSKIINRALNFTNMLNIAIHAITLSILLSAIYYVINVATGFYIKYFSIMYTSVAIIYMMTSILLITSDNNEDNNVQ